VIVGKPRRLVVPLHKWLSRRRLQAQATLPLSESTFMVSWRMVPTGRDWFPHLLFVALCLIAVLIWIGAGTVFDRPIIDETPHAD